MRKSLITLYRTYHGKHPNFSAQSHVVISKPSVNLIIESLKQIPPTTPISLIHEVFDEYVEDDDYGDIVPLEDGDIIELAKTLKPHHTIYDLKFRGNNITDIGAQVISAWPVKHELDLRANDITSYGIIQLCNVRCSKLDISLLDVKNTDRETYCIIENLINNTELCQLKMQGLQIKNHLIADLIARHKTLELIMLGRSVTDEAFRTLAKSDSLTKIVIPGPGMLRSEDNLITNKFVEYAVKSKSLEHIVIHNSVIDDKAVINLLKLPTLKILELYDSDISHEGIRNLPSCAPQIQCIFQNFSKPGLETAPPQETLGDHAPPPADIE